MAQVRRGRGRVSKLKLSRTLHTRLAAHTLHLHICTGFTADKALGLNKLLYDQAFEDVLAAERPSMQYGQRGQKRKEPEPPTGEGTLRWRQLVVAG